MRFALLLALLTINSVASAQEQALPRTRVALAPGERKPEKFEPYLKRHPGDLAYRQAALYHYGVRSHPLNLPSLRRHTLLMIRYHPEDFELGISNFAAYYSNPAYARDMIAAYEKRLSAGNIATGHYYNLAEACARAAVPPAGSDAPARKRFLRYYGLPANAPLRTTIDRPLANRAVAYYLNAIHAAARSPFAIGLYSENCADLLRKLGRSREGASVCEKALKQADEVSKPDLLVAYARCLRELKDYEGAKRVLASVRAADHEFGNGPGCATVNAETMWGSILLAEGSVVEASKHLTASANVEPCCHTTTQGMPVSLAAALLRRGSRHTVVEYCHTVLRKICPRDSNVQELLRRAEAIPVAKR